MRVLKTDVTLFAADLQLGIFKDIICSSSKDENLTHNITLKNVSHTLITFIL